MARYFVSYRHEDSIDITHRLCDHLKNHFGKSNVFLDIEKIPGGANFLETIHDAIRASDALVCIIGPHWMGPRGADEEPRIQESSDTIRKELEYAKRLGVPILPVLVSEARPLSEVQLPTTLKSLARINSLNLRSGSDFAGDVHTIIESLELLTNGGPIYRRVLAGTMVFPFSPPLTTAASRRRSLTLAAMRSTSVLIVGSTVLEGGRRFVNGKGIQISVQATFVEAITLVVAAIGIILLSVSWLRVRLISRAGRSRQDAALRELTSLVVSRLETPRLLSAGGVRGLAVSLEQKHRSPVITDKLIAESIRAAAIEVEYSVTGKQLEVKLEALNGLLLSIDESASSLCSVAVVDRLGAYTQSLPVFLGFVLVGLLVTSIWPIVGGSGHSFRLSLPIVASLTGVSVLLWLSTERAIRYWRTDESSQKRHSFVHPLTPARPRIPLDFFVWASASHSAAAAAVWHNLWGPVWEQIMFLWRNERQLAAMHEFRFDVAKETWRELKRVDILLEREVGDPVSRAIMGQQFRELTRKLWIVTGESQFRIMEARGMIDRADRESGMVGLL